MRKLMFSVIPVILTGCSMMNPAGIADYTLEPIVTSSGQVICCQAKIYNSKNVGEVSLMIHVRNDGTVEASLEEKGVDSVGPAAAAAASQVETMKMMNTLVERLPLVP